MLYGCFEKIFTLSKSQTLCGDLSPLRFSAFKYSQVPTILITRNFDPLVETASNLLSFCFLWFSNRIIIILPLFWQIVSEIRKTVESLGFVEVETPVLQVSYLLHSAFCLNIFLSKWVCSYLEQK